MFNYAIKSSFINAFLETVPELAAKRKEPYPSKERKFEDLVQEAQNAVGLVLAFQDNMSLQSQSPLSAIAASFNESNYVKAERLAKEQLARNPEDTGGLFFLGLSLYKMDRLDDAIPVFERVGYIAPKSQDPFSCWSGTFLGLSYFSKWLSSRANEHHRAASGFLQSTVRCPSGEAASQRAGIRTEDDAVAKFFSGYSSEREKLSDQALSRLSEITGYWNEPSPVSTTRPKYYYDLRGSRNTLTLKDSGTNEQIDATLHGDGRRYVGYGKKKYFVYVASCELDIELSLELSDDLQSLKVTERCLRWSGTKKDFCLDVCKEREFQLNRRE